MNMFEITSKMTVFIDTPKTLTNGFAQKVLQLTVSEPRAVATGPKLNGS